MYALLGGHFPQLRQDRVLIVVENVIAYIYTNDRLVWRVPYYGVREEDASRSIE